MKRTIPDDGQPWLHSQDCWPVMNSGALGRWIRRVGMRVSAALVSLNCAQLVRSTAFNARRITSFGGLDLMDTLVTVNVRASRSTLSLRATKPLRCSGIQCRF